jgi:acyl carrier protein
MSEVDQAARLTDDRMLEQLKTLARTELEMRPEQIEKIGFETSIVEGLQLDSLKQVVLMVNIEETYGFEFSLEDRELVQELQTVGDLVRLVRERVRRTGPWN